MKELSSQKSSREITPFWNLIGFALVADHSISLSDFVWNILHKLSQLLPVFSLILVFFSIL